MRLKQEGQTGLPSSESEFESDVDAVRRGAGGGNLNRACFNAGDDDDDVGDRDRERDAGSG